MDEKVINLIVSNEAAIGTIFTVLAAIVGGAISWGILLEKVRRHSSDINMAFNRIRELENKTHKRCDRED